MGLRKYELTLVLDAQLEQDKMDEIAQYVEKFIKDSKGKITKVDHWGKRRLAYEIRRKQYGHYVYILFESDGSELKEIERNLTLNESVLRFLTVKLDKPAVKFVEQELQKEESEAAAAGTVAEESAAE